MGRGVRWRADARELVRWLWRCAAAFVFLGVIAGVPGCSDASSPTQNTWYLPAPVLEDDAYVLQLTPQQQEAFASASYTLIKRETPDHCGYYPILSDVPVDVDATGRITIPKDLTVLEVVSDTGDDEMLCGLRWVSDDNGLIQYETDKCRLETLSSLLSFGLFSDFDYVTLRVSVDGQSNVVTTSMTRQSPVYPRKPRVKRSQLGMYRALGYVWQEARGKTTADDGTLAPISAWEGMGAYFYDECDYRTSPQFLMVPAYSLGADLFLQVAIEDADGVEHGSELVQLETHGGQGGVSPQAGRPMQKDGFSYELYDDHAELVAYEGSGEEVEVPALVAGVPVTVIGHSAFESNTHLRTIVLPDSIVEIRDQAFAGSHIRDFRVPPKLQYLGDGVFLRTPRLSRFIQPDVGPLTSVRDGVLYTADGRELLAYPSAKGTSFAIPEGVERVGTAAFAASTIERVSFPTTLRELEPAAFCECVALGVPELPEGLERIGAGAFGAHYHTDVISDAAEDEGDWLTIELGPNVSSIGREAFSNWMLDAIEVDDKNPWYKSIDGFLIGADGTLLEAPRHLKAPIVVPEGVTSLATEVFASFKREKYGNASEPIDIVLPQSLRTIGKDALPTTIESNEMSSSGTEINASLLHVPRGSWAESYAQENKLAYDNAPVEQESWELVELSQHKATLTFRVYADHAALAGIVASDAGHVEVPNEVRGVPVTTIGVNSEDTAMGVVKTLVLPSSMEATAGYLLWKMNDVRQFELSASNALFSIRNGSLCSADGTTLIVYPGARGETYEVPQGVKTISSYAFYEASVQSVILPEGVQRIEANAFDSCYELSEASFPTSLTYIGPSAFRSTKLKDVNLNDGLVTIGMDAFDLPDRLALDDLRIPDSVESIGENAFGRASADKRATITSRTIEIGSGLKELETSAFHGADFDTFSVSTDNQYFKAEGPYLLSKDGKVLYACAPTAGPELHIPGGVETISDYALHNISDLTDVYLPQSLLRMSSVVFDRSLEGSLTLHCPPDSEALLLARSSEYRVVVEDDQPAE